MAVFLFWPQFKEICKPLTLIGFSTVCSILVDAVPKKTSAY